MRPASKGGRGIGAAKELAAATVFLLQLQASCQRARPVVPSVEFLRFLNQVIRNDRQAPKGKIAMSRIKMLKPRLSELDLRTAREPAKVTDRIYSSRQWLGLMATLKKRRGHKCEQCGSSSGRIYGDHIVELKDSGAAFDAGNVRLLCASCHGAKTAKRRAERLLEPISRRRGT
jgi:5-methylcytosine-specific restriction protein A